MAHRGWEVSADPYKSKRLLGYRGYVNSQELSAVRDSNKGVNKTDVHYENTIINLATELAEVHK